MDVNTFLVSYSNLTRGKEFSDVISDFFFIHVFLFFCMLPLAKKKMSCGVSLSINPVSHLHAVLFISAQPIGWTFIHY